MQGFTIIQCLWNAAHITFHFIPDNHEEPLDQTRTPHEDARAEGQPLLTQHLSLNSEA